MLPGEKLFMSALRLLCQIFIVDDPSNSLIRRREWKADTVTILLLF